MSKSAPPVKTFPFVNKKGKRIRLRGDLTIKDLVKMGMVNIRVVKPEEPLVENEWRECGRVGFPVRESRKPLGFSPDAASLTLGCVIAP